MPRWLSCTTWLLLISCFAPFTTAFFRKRDTAVHRGGSTTTTTPTGSSGRRHNLLRVAYQGEPGAYSDASTRELLGANVMAVGKPSFEDCFKAVALQECEYACLPVENSLGGSIHENYDLLLRYDLTIVAEHEFRVHHCLLARPGVEKSAIKYAISHPQALAQCDGFLRSLGITPIATYDTAGSAKMIAEGAVLPADCTVENTAAIASKLAGKIYGLHALNVGIEDDDTNFTRFLLLGRKSVVEHLKPEIAAKTSVVFTLPNTPGALYKALACFSLRDIDFSKIESRPTSASLLNYLKFRQQGRRSSQQKRQQQLPRFRYCFYLDFLANQLDESASNALAHLREQSEFLRVLGSYPQKSQLVGPVAVASQELQQQQTAQPLSILNDNEPAARKPLRIGIVGSGSTAQTLLKRLVDNQHTVSCLLTDDRDNLERGVEGVEMYPNFQVHQFLDNLDVVVVAVPLVEVVMAMELLPADSLTGKLVVDANVLNGHPKAVMLELFGSTNVDLLTIHPVPEPWEGRPLVYDRVRISVDPVRCEQFLQNFARCQMVEMNAEEHDETVADAELVTHMTGLLLELPPTPVGSPEYQSLQTIVDTADFETFFGLCKFHVRAVEYLAQIRENLSRLEQQLAARDAYLTATAEMRRVDRQRLLAEAKSLLQQVAAETVRERRDSRGGGQSTTLGDDDDDGSDRRR